MVSRRRQGETVEAPPGRATAASQPAFFVRRGRGSPALAGRARPRSGRFAAGSAYGCRKSSDADPTPPELKRSPASGPD